MIVLANIAGFLYSYRRVILVGAAGVVLLLVIVFLFRACSKPPKLDQKEIIKAQQAIAKEDRKVMVEILAQSDAKEAAIDSNIKLIEQATEEAKKNYTGLTNDELAAELERRSKE